MLRVNDSFDKLTTIVAFALKNHDNNVHNFRAECGASHENALNDGGSEGLELCVTVLDELKGRVAKFVQLRSNQVLEHVYRWETWNLVTFMHRDGTFNCHV